MTGVQTCALPICLALSSLRPLIKSLAETMAPALSSAGLSDEIAKIRWESVGEGKRGELGGRRSNEKKKEAEWAWTRGTGLMEKG